MIKIMSIFLVSAIILSIASSSIGDLEDNLCRDVMIIGRREWGAKNETSSAKNITDPSVNVNFVVIHHTKGRNCTTNSECKQRVREVERFDIDVLEKNDILMHFLIGGDNRVYEGRGWGVEEEAIPNYPFALSIGFIGDFDSNVVPSAMLYAAQKLIQCGVKKIIFQGNSAFSEIRNEVSGNKFENVMAVGISFSKVLCYLGPWWR